VLFCDIKQSNTNIISSHPNHFSLSLKPQVQHDFCLPACILATRVYVLFVDFRLSGTLKIHFTNISWFCKESDHISCGPACDSPVFWCLVIVLGGLSR
jgi:hypothetical protein